MYPKMNEWLYTRGRRLAELKVLGGTEMFEEPSSRDMTKLTPNEWTEYLILSGQLDALIWALGPEDPDEALAFIGELSNILHDLEMEAEQIRNITGMRTAIKGSA